MRLAPVLFAGLALTALALADARADALDDLTKAEQQAHQAWQNLALTERKWTFVTGEVKGYGMYQERQSNLFKPSDKIITYVEPIGYKWKPIVDGMFEVGFSVDVTLRDDKDEIIFAKQGFLGNEWQSHNAGMEYFLVFTLTASDLPPGRYAVTYTLHDTNGDQSSSFDQDFRIEAD